MAERVAPLSPEASRLLAQIAAESRGIDYSQPGPRPPAQPWQSAGPPAESPLANRFEGWALNQPGIWQNLRAFAPAVRSVERGARGMVGMAGEATGVPAAQRAGTALAEGNYVQGAGQAMMALPARAAALPGMLFSQAEAQQPDPRAVRLQKLNTEVAGHRRKLEEMAKVNYRSTKARSDASAPYLSAITKAETEATKLQDTLNAEYQAANDARLASERGASWARTPFQKRYPGALEGGVAATAAVGGLVPFLATRGRVRHHVTQVQALDDQIVDAINRANTTTLRQGQTHAALARERTQAANEARALQAQRDQLAQQGTGDHGMRGHLGAAAGGGALTELPMAGALAHDYLAGRADPSGELYDRTLESVNIVDHPGAVLGRYAIPFGLGAAAGGAGHYLGSQGGDVPAGHAGGVRALKQQYRAPRKR